MLKDDGMIVKITMLQVNSDVIDKENLKGENL